MNRLKQFVNEHLVSNDLIKNNDNEDFFFFFLSNQGLSIADSYDYFMYNMVHQTQTTKALRGTCKYFLTLPFSKLLLLTLYWLQIYWALSVLTAYRLQGIHFLLIFFPFFLMKMFQTYSDILNYNL